MKDNKLDNILTEGGKGKNRGNTLLQKIKILYHEKIDVLRGYIAGFAGLSLGIANWSKDFGADKIVHLPFIFTNTSIAGSAWYNLAFMQEIATMASLVITAKEKAKMLAYSIAYETGSAINAYLYYSAIKTGTSLYGIEWNDIFYFFQIPVFILSLRHYFGKRNYTKDKLPE